MSGIKYILQKDLFDEENERILCVLSVCKLFKKKKISYLCITSIKNKNLISICQVKQYDKGVYKKKRSWTLEEVKVVDGRNILQDTHEFDLLLDKNYRWFAANLHERQNFLTVLWRQINKHMITNKAIFKNIPETWLTVPDSNTKDTTGKANDGDDETTEYEEFNALTEREEIELNKWIGEYNYAIGNAELFIEQLTKNLVELDGANVESILATSAEQQVLDLMLQIDSAIDDVETVEKRLDEYEEIMCHIRDAMEKMGEKNAMIEIANSNNIKLLQELDKVVTQLDLPHAHQNALTETDLTSAKGLQSAILAGKALQNAMNSDIDPSLLRLTAVQDQRKRFEKWKAKFSQTISRHLNNLFIHLGNDIGDSSSHHSELILPKHNHHRELLAYQELMHWMKCMDRKAYERLTKVYTSSLSKVYERDIRTFFEQAKSLVLKNREDEMNTSVSSKLKGQPAKQTSAPVYGILGLNKDQWSTGIDANERKLFDSVLEKVLTELEPIALSEQLFCINFFKLDTLSPNGGKNTQTTLDDDSLTPSKEESSSILPQKRIDRQINEEVRRMMGELFGILEVELVNFILNFEKLDCFYSLYVFVRLNQHVMSAQDAQSFLSMTYASVLVQVKRNFDKFMNTQLQSIQEAKVPKRSKCGLLCYVENFEEFASTTEGIFKKSERRTDLDKWYVKLVDAIFQGINQHSFDHPKTPNQVIKMENFHHMNSQLARLKVSVLDNLKKEAKQKYIEALRSYVTKYFGRPLEKLNLFFEGVQIKVAQGVKESEISYQMAYSKQELRKVISQYPAREVKKGLESLYKKVEKHLCDEENLLQVVWRAMQEEFIAQYNFLEERIQRCYAGAMISLDFNIQEILDFFSEIARSH
ncbi:unnamed protein product [Diamesa hyperborea]